FLPSPPTENSNVSVYDLIETEFRSGVRYRKRPTMKKASSELSSTEPMSLEVARFLDTASSVVWNYLPDDRRMQIHKTRVAELQAAQHAATKPNQLYDGRPFAEWLSVVNTERSPERLAEAVNAIAILGKGGRDSEAAFAIFKCISHFSGRQLSNAEVANLLATCDKRLFELDDHELASVILEIIHGGTSNQRWHILTRLRNQVESWHTSRGFFELRELFDALMMATDDPSEFVRSNAAHLLVPVILGERQGLDATQLSSARTRMVKLLGDEQSKTKAAVCLSILAPQTDKLPEILLAEIDRLTVRRVWTTSREIDAHWALRHVLINDSQSVDQVIETLSNLVDKSEHRETVQFSAESSQFLTHHSLILELLVEAQSRSKTDASKLIRRIEESKERLDAVLIKFNKEFSEAEKSEAGLTTYSPVLIDEYQSPFLRTHRKHEFQQLLTQQADATASKWALEQLEKSSTPEKADE
ncbi:MAG: hypothetical protein ACKVHE_35215, partial [Planctomycetales bacterium]